MRCTCKICEEEIWMVQSESAALGCVCPVCGYRCTDCLGTDTVVPRDRVAALAADPRFDPDRLMEAFAPREEDGSAPQDADWIQRYGGCNNKF